MPGEAQRVIEEFWRIQDAGDYTRLAPLFAEDAFLEDPIWGQYRGREAILGFMTKMVEEMGGAKSASPSMKSAATITRCGRAGRCTWTATRRAAAWASTR